MLSDSQIKHELRKGGIVIDPLDPANIQPASVDLHLGRGFRVFDSDGMIDPFAPRFPMIPEMLETVSDGPLWVRPGQFLLGHTAERISLSPRLIGRLEGKSSIGRLGLAVHVTAGFFDPGWDGQGTLEIVNLSPYMWCLRPGMPICQMAFNYVTGVVERPYGTADNHYQASEGVVPMRLRGQVEPHHYWPDSQAMGDCAVCGHGQSSSLHLP